MFVGMPVGWYDGFDDDGAGVVGAAEGSGVEVGCEDVGTLLGTGVTVGFEVVGK